jgi:uncharacterized protein YegP (UPF0339 family)
MEPVVPKRPTPSFLVFRNQQGRWRWNFAAANGKIVAASTVAYERREGCMRALKQMKGQIDVPVLLREQPMPPAIEENPVSDERDSDVALEQAPTEEIAAPVEDGTLNLEVKQILH